uniref:Soluble scavenger receptor cysteine-rich domain-containing protein SSC5D n=1 Tax=Anser brachyrhynchus TaxID=132585 RepID=A0A8B9BCW8_9AVES
LRMGTEGLLSPWVLWLFLWVQQCRGKCQLPCPTTWVPEGSGNSQYTGFRLVNGSTACAGRVEVEVLGTWGTLCASRWDLSDAHVLCRHLGCGFAESIPGGGHFGRGTGPVWRDSFHCDGTEAHLGQCPVTALGASQCSHENAAAVICSGECWAVLQRSRCDGRVEVFQHGTWGRVLDEQWDMQEASVVCRQLQCGEAEAAYTPARAEQGLGPMGLRGVQCTGHEADLSLCNTSLPESVPSPGLLPPAGSRQVQLADGAGRCAGRVEIYYQGRWGTICDDAWDLADAAVICRQLGCGGAVEAAGSAQFGEGSGQIWLGDSGACQHKKDATRMSHGMCQMLCIIPGYEVHCSSLNHKHCNPTPEGHQICQELSALNEQSFQEDLFHDLSRHRGGTGWPVVPWACILFHF